MTAPFGTLDPRSWCFWHGYEPAMPGDFWVCGECWHIWRTPEQFAADVAEVAPDLVHPTPENTYACPRCAHDW